MDLNYTDAARTDLGVIPTYELDLAFGEDENDFSLKLPLSAANLLTSGSFIFMSDGITGTEYGGMVTGVDVNSENDFLERTGKTFHGLLDDKVIRPAAGNDYYVVSGDANTVIAQIISDFDLGDTFRAAPGSSGLSFSSYKFSRYCTAYQGLKRALDDIGGKLKMSYQNGYVTLSAVPLVDYTLSEQWDSDQMALNVIRDDRPVNHLICLGAGNLRDRLVVDLYANARGKISTTQTFTGDDEVCYVYEYTTANTVEELTKNGTTKFKELRNDALKTAAELNNAGEYDIGDVVGCKEVVTGEAVTASITKKIVTVRSGRFNVSYKIGDIT